MTILSYLNEIANNSILKGSEKIQIQVSIDTLQKRLFAYFGGDISSQTLFGSYTRGTILPRSFDSLSDVDYLVVFKDSSYRPQTYLDRLRRFVERYYSTSEIQQSHPTIQLELNHIRFELVPAKKEWSNGLQIPAKASGYQDWQDTDPTGFNNRLISVNQNHRSLIKHLVRVMKYWNVSNGRPFDSYELEKNIVVSAEGLFSFCGCANLWDYLYKFTSDYDIPWLWTSSKKERFQRLKSVCLQAKSLETQGYPSSAEKELKKVIPACRVYR